MSPDQLIRLEALRDKLMERAIVDADPANWAAGDKAPKDMTREERGDAKWCRGLAINTVSLAMQVQRLMLNPTAGGALVPDKMDAETEPQEETIEAEVARFEEAAAQVLAARAVTRAKNGRAKR
mgnify:CR=1 FL=1